MISLQYIEIFIVILFDFPLNSLDVLFNLPTLEV